jgi:Na+/H+-dicarboxylate symporter
MKIYTKILIGMAVGAVIGLTLGPKSSFLEHDLYKVKSLSKVNLVVGSPEGTPIEFGKEFEKVEANLKVLETKNEKRSSKGQEYDLRIWAKVDLEYSKHIALKDKKAHIADLLKDDQGKRPRVGDSRPVYLILENEELEGGGFLTTPQPISDVGDTIITVMQPVGELFMRLIKMVIVPLVFASLLVGVASLGDIRKLGRLGGKTLGLYLCTTATAVTIGLTMAHVIQPGNFVGDADKAELVKQFEGDAGKKADNAAEAPSTIDNILNIIPENPVESLSSGDMLQVIFFALLFGIALTLLKEERSRQVINFMDTVQHAMIMIIHMVMAVAPYGVAALLAEVVGQSGFSVLKALVVYSLTVLLGLAVLAGGVYGGLTKFLARVPWTRFMKAARPAQLIAFSTSSSSAALPVTMECAEENLGVSNGVTSFVVPLGATVNMDGTALYQGVAAIFIAQVFGIDLTFGDQVGIVLAATMASVGAAGVPGAGMITLAMVLTASGIPPVGVALILGVDRLLDMFRSAVNVTGDLCVTTVMAVSEGETIRTLSPDEDVKDPSRGFERRLDKDEHPVVPDDDPEPDTQDE